MNSENTHDQIEDEVEITKAWRLWAFGIYVTLSIVAASIDVFVLDTQNYLQGWVFLINSMVILAISLFFGMFAEYSRQRIKLEASNVE